MLYLADLLITWLMRLLCIALASALVPLGSSAQVLDIRTAAPRESDRVVSTLKLRQTEFEGFRRQNLPSLSLSFGGGSGGCDEQVGRFCYWYDDTQEPPPGEGARIREARARFIVALDSAVAVFPDNEWINGALVRYLAEAKREAEGVTVAKKCVGDGWFCPALRGFALHLAGRFAESDQAWTKALAAMDPQQACEWRDLKLILDDALLRDYRGVRCEARVAQEARVWWLARPMMSSEGNDARTEYLSRVFYAHMLNEAPSVYQEGFDSDERELLLRYGWPRDWTTASGYLPGRGSQVVITGHEPTPAPPMLPLAATVKNPAFSDSLQWRGKGLPGVRARYSPAGARRLLALQHQSAVFRRGDTALVAMSYNVAADTALATAARVGDRGPSGGLRAALVLTRGVEGDATIARVETPGVTGVVTAMMPWGPMLMSAEVGDPSRSTLARARYGLRLTDTPTSRVSISDLLLFNPYDGVPRSLEDALPHMRSSQILGDETSIGIYWETYNTNPTGEGIQVSITVAPEESNGGWLRRGLTKLRLARESEPVSVGLTDVSARGRGFTPRAVVVDLATLKKGRYLMQLEITAEGAIPVRTERVITVR